MPEPAIVNSSPLIFETLGIPHHGTLGLAMVAKKRGRIPTARPIVEILKRHGTYLSNQAIDRALALIGE